MTLDDIDKTGLIREAYRIEGITPEECRSIFLDWAIKLPAGQDTTEALKLLIATYADGEPDHPMSTVLNDGLKSAGTPRRRGGRSARVSGS